MASGTQVVLDTKAAELSSQWKFMGFAAGARWSNSGRGKPPTPSQHFLDGEMARADRLARQIKDLKLSDDMLSK